MGDVSERDADAVVAAAGAEGAWLRRRLEDLDVVEPYASAGARVLLCPICLKARKLDQESCSTVPRSGRDPAVGVDRRKLPWCSVTEE